jgi:uncharacterized protein
MSQYVGTPAIVVTGASSGIGREIARIASADCQTLVLIGRRKVELTKLAQELSAQGVTAFPLELDLSQPSSALQIEKFLTEQGLYCRILVNSAGFGVFGAAAEADPDLQAQLIDVNVKAAVTLTLKFLPGMLARGQGGIVNVASITAYASGPYMAAYCASKAFIRSWSTALSAEVANSGVTITCLVPGVVRTAFFDRKAMRNSRLLKILPRGNAVDTAKAGWTAFKGGKSLVVPRPIDRFIIWLCWIMPSRPLIWMISRLQRKL